MRRRRHAMGAVVGLLLLAVPARAQEAAVEETTTTTSTSTTSTSTTTTVPPTGQVATPHPRPVEREAPAAPLDDPDEPPAEAPPEPVTVPPRDQPRPPTEQEALTTDLVTTTLDTAAQSLAGMAALENDAIAHAVKLDAELNRKEVRLNELRQGRLVAQRLLAAKRAEVKRRAIAAYTGGRAVHLDSLLDVPDVNELVRRTGFVEAVTAQDQKALREYVETKATADADLTNEERDVEATRVLAEQARRQAAQATELRLRHQVEVDALRYGGSIVVAGFSFPVDEPFSFVDTFGAPRMTGTQFEHRHQGTDIFAPYGTPLRAVERGVVTRVGTDRLGGRKLWLVGASGTRYYYAHLSGYAPNVADGLVVEAGELVGYVGNTGNAQSTPPHLHFEAHPGGGPAINPYPLLRASADATRAARARALAVG
ncbi:MAG TPA: M23 family metallopeptidase [Acidimicrobiales bacterium]|nr:M23 family metallopeptidase [Acidimicrobiales bacterium]